ncbi:KptA family-domain-containing protein [Kockiozyma suomiensis]|uniref:KptA family-domain-containing protein n=1 Tax=Kockiozyma suomiensis TaxID=1337062 RepID=UPI00334368C9
MSSVIAAYLRLKQTARLLDIPLNELLQAAAASARADSLSRTEIPGDHILFGKTASKRFEHLRELRTLVEELEAREQQRVQRKQHSSSKPQVFVSVTDSKLKDSFLQVTFDLTVNLNSSRLDRDCLSSVLDTDIAQNSTKLLSIINDMAQMRNPSSDNQNPQGRISANMTQVSDHRSTRDIRLSTISKKLAGILRHNAVSQNIEIDSEGYVSVAELLERKVLGGMSFADLKTIVTGDSKSRYKLQYRGTAEVDVIDEDSSPEHWYIRANQGHSIPHVQIVLRRLTDPESISLAVHGTMWKNWPSILRHGLSAARRLHIHLAQHLPDSNKVVSGLRPSSNTLIFVNVERAMADGIDFFESENGVILTSGQNGVLHPRYFDRVLHRTDSVDGKKEWNLKDFTEVEFDKEAVLEPIAEDSEFGKALKANRQKSNQRNKKKEAKPGRAKYFEGLGTEKAANFTDTENSLQADKSAKVVTLLAEPVSRKELLHAPGDDARDSEIQFDIDLESKPPASNAESKTLLAQPTSQALGWQPSHSL